MDVETAVKAPPALEDMIWADESVQIIDSKFPCRVNTSLRGVTDNIRAYIVRMPDPGDHLDFALAMFDGGTGDGPTLYLVDYVTTIATLTPSVVRLELESLGFAGYEINGGCGCGSRLKSYNPWGKRMVGAAKPELPWSYVP